MTDRTKRIGRTAAAVLLVAGPLVLPLGADGRDRQTAPASSRGGVSTTTITPVEGPSTLRHLGLTIEQSSMGWAGQWSGPPTAGASDESLRSEPVGGPFVLTGADLYRVSCRPCHRPSGEGGPPEINSLLGPVRAASFAWMMADMKARGRSVDGAFIRELTTQNEADLRKRLRQGGHNMPAFGQISDQEYAVLRPHLDALAGVTPAARGPRTIVEPADRVGELIVKGTCHICHDATADVVRPTTVLSGVIPALRTLPTGKSSGEFVQKVREGAQVALGSANVQSRGRMPVFSYFTEAEARAAYSFLMTYPPQR
jgi:mono/diheme cytochrome c family protein